MLGLFARFLLLGETTYLKGPSSRLLPILESSPAVVILIRPMTLTWFSTSPQCLALFETPQGFSMNLLRSRLDQLLLIRVSSLLRSCLGFVHMDTTRKAGIAPCLPVNAA